MTHLHTFSGATHRLHAFASSFDWLAGVSVYFGIGAHDYIVYLVPDNQLKPLYDLKKCNSSTLKENQIESHCLFLKYT